MEGGEDLAVLGRDGEVFQRQFHPGLAPDDQCIQMPAKAGFKIEEFDQAEVRPVLSQPQLSRDEGCILGV